MKEQTIQSSILTNINTSSLDLALTSLVSMRDDLEQRSSELDTAMKKMKKENFEIYKRHQNVSAQILCITQKKEALISISSERRCSEIQNLPLPVENGVKSMDLPSDPNKCISFATKSAMETFLEQQIVELELELECPVCLEVASTAPIYKCTDDHIICRCPFQYDISPSNNCKMLNVKHK